MATTSENNNSENRIKVKEIYVRRFKKIEDLKQNWDGQSVIIMGPNERGKTSLQQAIRYLLGDTDAIPPGEFPEAEMTITKGDKTYTIRGEIHKGKGRIIVKSEDDGLEDSRPETLVKLIGATKFNPFEFVEKSKTKAGRKEQVEDIKKQLPIEIQNDLAKYEADVAAKYEERTNLNRDLKNAKGSIETHPLYNVPEKELRAMKAIDVSATFSELKEAENVNQKIESVKTRILIRDEEIKSNIDEVNELKMKINALEFKIQENQRLNNDANSWLDQNKPINTDGLKQTIESSQKVNEEFNRAQELIKFYERKEVLENNVGQLTVDIEQGREMIANAVKECAHIFEGLSYDDEGLTLNGIPVHPASLSTSQIIKLAYQIKMYENPNAPLFVDALESFDEEKYNALIELGKVNDIQIIGAEVRRDKKQLEFHIIPA